MSARYNEIIEYVKLKTGIKNDSFIASMVLYKLSQVANNMQPRIELPDGTKVPINVYSIALAKSGFNKGLTINLLEDNIFSGFKDEFLNKFAPRIFEKTIGDEVYDLSIKENITEQEASKKVYEEVNRLPSFLYSFSDATVEGVKAMRRKLEMSGAGGLAFEVDEIGHSLERIEEVLGVFLEQYDMGKTKAKLIKTESNKDGANITASLLFFGTPHTLLNGSNTEKIFFNKLREGYARRLLFSYVEPTETNIKLTPEEKYEQMVNSAHLENSTELNDYFKSLAHEDSYRNVLPINKDAMLLNLTYQRESEEEAEKISEYKDILKTELTHRYWKALKIAGILSWIEKKEEVTLEDMETAIEICNKSTDQLEKLLDRPSDYVRLSDFIINSDMKLTMYDIAKNLHFFSGSKSKKEDMINMATSYAYTNNQLIKRSYFEGIEFFTGENLKVTNLNKMILSYSTNLTEGYENVTGSWDNLPNIVCAQGLHYSNHHYKDGYRNNENALPEINMVILDVDDGISIEAVKLLMEGYKMFIATTKSHNKAKKGIVCERFRIVIPLKFSIDLNHKEYQEFMKNLFNDLPFEVDTATSDAARKFESYEGFHWFMDGEMLDPTNYIPNTQKEAKKRELHASIADGTALERYILMRYDSLGRNNSAIKYALALVDNGMVYDEIEDKIFLFNSKLPDPLPDTELFNTVLKTVKKRIHEME